MNQPHVYTSPPCWASLPFPAPHSSRLLQSPDLSSLSYTANFHWLSILHMVVHISPSSSACLALSFRPSVCISLFSISMHPLLIVVLTGSCLMTSDVEQIFLCLTCFHISSFWSVCSNLPPTFFLLNLRKRDREVVWEEGEGYVCVKYTLIQASTFDFVGLGEPQSDLSIFSGFSQGHCWHR